MAAESSCGWRVSQSREFLVILEIISLTSSSITPTRVDFFLSKGLGVVMISIEVIIAYFKIRGKGYTWGYGIKKEVK